MNTTMPRTAPSTRIGRGEHADHRVVGEVLAELRAQAGAQAVLGDVRDPDDRARAAAPAPSNAPIARGLGTGDAERRPPRTRPRSACTWSIAARSIVPSAPGDGHEAQVAEHLPPAPGRERASAPAR